MITPPRTKVKSENPAIPFYITRSQKLILIAPPNQIFPRLTSQTIRGMGMESHSSRIVLPIEKYFPWPKHGIQRSRSLSITCCLLMRISLAVTNFFIVREIFVDRTFFMCENFLSMENFFIDMIENLKFLKTIQNFMIDHGVSTGQQSFLVPLHNRQTIKANNIILERLGKKQPCKVRM